MGFEIHSANFLKYALQRNQKDEAVMFGRQSIKLLPDRYLKKAFGITNRQELGDFAEALLTRHYKLKNVISVDNSSYENATVVIDMNKPIPEQIKEQVEGKYDLALDLGTLEHIYNVPQALYNMSMFCSSNATIVHVLPANGWVGHGFYQFSPELFFSVYSERNGYKDTEVFLVNCQNNKYWYRVRKPENGVRSVAEGRGEAYVMVKTTKIKNGFNHDDIQQSDFVAVWNKTDPKTHRASYTTSGLKAILKKSDLITWAYGSLNRRLRNLAAFIKGTDRISSGNPSLTKLSVDKLIN